MMHWKAAALGLTLIGSIASASAQGYGGSDGYRERSSEGYRGPDRERGSSDRDRDRGDRFNGGGRQASFDAREYLRCNPDVQAAIRAGKMESASAHYRTFGRRENRPLSC